eukprot:6458398-Amphidinium_carterae.1
MGALRTNDSIRPCCRSALQWLCPGSWKAVQRTLGTWKAQARCRSEVVDGREDVRRRRLTWRIKNSGSATALLEILEKELESPLFNEFHLGATYARLAHLKAVGLHVPPLPQQWQIEFLGSSRKVAPCNRHVELESSRPTTNVGFCFQATCNSRVASHPVMATLISKTRAMTETHTLNARAVANILWAIGSLRDELRVLQVLHGLMH